MILVGFGRFLKMSFGIGISELPFKDGLFGLCIGCIHKYIWSYGSI